MTVDFSKVRREGMRWQILLTLDNARPVGAWEEMILTTVQAINADATALEVRRELDYLHDRQLIEVEKDPSDRWHASLTRHGVDVVEYTVTCEPGIARPAQKYWTK